jgi:hypothetical protein
MFDALYLKDGLVKENGAPDRIRTCDLPLRRGPRYPAVPPGHNDGRLFYAELILFAT